MNPVHSPSGKTAKLLTFDEFVTVQRFQPDFESLVEGMVERLAISECDLPSYQYFNPLATVECDKANGEFFMKARKAQGEWCQLASSTFGRRNRRSVREWACEQGRVRRESRYWHRAACWQGLLFIDGRFTPPSRWPDRNGHTTTPNKRTLPTIQSVFEELLALTDPEYWQQRFAVAGLSFPN